MAICKISLLAKGAVWSTLMFGVPCSLYGGGGGGGGGGMLCPRGSKYMDWNGMDYWNGLIPWVILQTGVHSSIKFCIPPCFMLSP